MLTREDVTAAYKMILGREPENDEVVMFHIGNAGTPEALRNSLLTSGEFFSRFDGDEGLRQALKPLYTKLQSLLSHSPTEKDGVSQLDGLLRS